MSNYDAVFSSPNFAYTDIPEKKYIFSVEDNDVQDTRFFQQLAKQKFRVVAKGAHKNVIDAQKIELSSVNAQVKYETMKDLNMSIVGCNKLYIEHGEHLSSFELHHLVWIVENAQTLLRALNRLNLPDYQEPESEKRKMSRKEIEALLLASMKALE